MLRATDLVLAVNELLTNSVRHGGGSGVLRIWQDDHTLVCEVRDRGRITDPLADRRRPDPGRTGGRGLWVANQLCDLVQLRSLDGENVVRVSMHRSQAVHR
jgi:anti-sigma regulatory factor (Ser/Thr protein kinase)